MKASLVSLISKILLVLIITLHGFYYFFVYTTFVLFGLFFFCIYNFCFSCQYVISFMALAPINNKSWTIIK